MNKPRPNDAKRESGHVPLVIQKYFWDGAFTIIIGWLGEGGGENSHNQEEEEEGGCFVVLLLFPLLSFEHILAYFLKTIKADDNFGGFQEVHPQEVPL